MTTSTELRLDLTEEKCYTPAHSGCVTDDKFKLYSPNLGNLTVPVALGWE
jgi:hypothetical protein